LLGKYCTKWLITLTETQRSQVVLRNRCKETRPERFRYDFAEAVELASIKIEACLAGKPDMVFAKAHVVVFLMAIFGIVGVFLFGDIVFSGVLEKQGQRQLDP